MKKRHETWKRILSGLLAFVLLLSLAPSALAYDLGEAVSVSQEERAQPGDETAGTEETPPGTQPEGASEPSETEDQNGEAPPEHEGEEAPDASEEAEDEEETENEAAEEDDPEESPKEAEEAPEEPEPLDPEAEEDLLAQAMAAEFLLSGEGSVYSINSIYGLQSFRNSVNLGSDYTGMTVCLTADLDLGDELWTPIGTSGETAFRGTFDGQNHTVSGLYLENNAEYQGLFGYLAGTVENLSVSGAINARQNYAAGIAGYNTGTIRNCLSAVTVTCVGDWVYYHAGIVGGNTGTIEGCVNTGEISGITAIAGIAGRSSGTVRLSYNMGTVTGSGSHIGGIVGQQQQSSGRVEHCYNAGQVPEGGSNVGALVGQQQSGAVENSYYLEGSSEFGIGSKSGVAGVLTADQMRLASFVDDLNGEDGCFVMDRQESNGGYPVLSWQLEEAVNELPVFHEASAASWQLAQYIEAAVSGTKSRYYAQQDNILGNFTESSTGTDWTALAMGRYGFYDEGAYRFIYDDGTGYGDFLGALETYVTETYESKGGVLDANKATEWHRVVLAILALGGDPTAFGSYAGAPIDLVADGTYHHPSPGWQGVNGWVYGLIALDALQYEVPAGAGFQREDFIIGILALQLSDGVNGNDYAGWAMTGRSTEPDITAMAIQALAPYYHEDTVYTYTNTKSGESLQKTVRDAVDEALDGLGDIQLADGDYSLWGDVNSESVAQVLLALVTLGIDPVTDARFIKEGNTLLDGLLKYQLSDGTFSHGVRGGSNAMATDQAAYALVGYWRLLNGMRGLYDFREDWSSGQLGRIRAATGAIATLPKPEDPGYKQALKSALAAFRAVEDSERQYVYNYAALRAAIEMVGGEAALDNDDPYLTGIAVTAMPKLHYFERERFDPEGMAVTVYWSNGEEEAVTGYSWQPNGALSLNDAKITIRYGALSAELSVTVEEKPPWQGEGTEEAPYLIATGEDLLALHTLLNTEGKPSGGRFWRIIDDIDLDGMTWRGIGTSSNPFRGSLDGDGFVIQNLTSGQGLFAYAGGDFTIENLGIASGSITGTNFIGAFVGQVKGNEAGETALLRNCWNAVDITASSGYSGGLVGSFRETGTLVIEGCYNMGAVVSAFSGNVGGIIGDAITTPGSPAIQIQNCYNTGAVSGNSRVGGIAGWIRSVGGIAHCYNIGQIAETGSSGGIVGELTAEGGTLAAVQNCYYLAQENLAGVGSGNAAAAALTGADMQDTAFLDLLGEAYQADFAQQKNSGYPIHAWQQPPSGDVGISAIAMGAYAAEATQDPAVWQIALPEGRFESYTPVVTTYHAKATVSPPQANSGFTAWTFTVTAEDRVTSQAYTLYVLKQEENGGGTNPGATDTIVTDLDEGKTYQGSYYTFRVTARDEKGHKLDSTVTFNGVALSPTWDDEDKTSYTLHFKNAGLNTVVVKAGAATAIYELTYEPVPNGTVIGQIVMAVEGFSFGGGYVMEPRYVDIKEGENGAQLLARVLAAEGYGYTNTGSLTGSFYLESLTGSGLTSLPTDLGKTPGYLKSLVERDFNTAGRASSTALGEFDFTNGSGWMYCVNNYFPNVGFADYYFTDGDVLRVQFTLALGADIGGTTALGASGASYYAVADKDGLTSLIARYGLEAVSRQSLEIMMQLNATQAQVRTAMENILTDDKTGGSGDTTVNLSVVAKDGVAEARITTEEVETALEERKEAGGSGTLVFRVAVEGEGLREVAVTLESAGIALLAKEEGLSIRVETPLAAGTLQGQGLQALQAGVKEQIVIAFSTEGQEDLTLSLYQDGALLQSVAGGVYLSVSVTAVSERTVTETTVLVLTQADGPARVLSQTAWGQSDTLRVTVEGSSTVKVADNRQSYDDVTNASWAFAFVSYVAARELLQGADNGLFGPLDAVNYGILFACAMRLEQNGADWQIPDGLQDEVDLQEILTREQMAGWLYAYAQYMGLDTEVYDIELAFSDLEEVSEELEEVVLWAIGIGLFQGDENQALRPGDVITKAEYAVLLQRLIQTLH